MTHYSVEYREGDLEKDTRVNVPKRFFKDEGKGGLKEGLRVRMVVENDPDFQRVMDTRNTNMERMLDQYNRNYEMKMKHITMKFDLLREIKDKVENGELMTVVENILSSMAEDSEKRDRRMLDQVLHGEE